MKKLLLLLPVLLLLCRIGFAQDDEEDPTYFRIKTKPTVKVASTRTEGNAQIKQIFYNSPRSHKISAWLVEPKTDGPHKVLIYQHGFGQTKDAFLKEAVQMAQQGYVCLLPEAPWLRDENRKRSFITDTRYYFDLGVGELQKSIEFVLAQNNVDTARLGYIGHGYGAQLGAILGTRMPQLKAMALLGGSAALSQQMLNSQQPYWVNLRDSIPDVLKKVAADVAIYDADRFMARVKAPVFHQFGNTDARVGYNTANRLADLTQSPKLVRYYEGGHNLNAEAAADRKKWLNQVLGAIGSPELQALQALPNYFTAQLPLHFQVPDSLAYFVMKDRMYSRANGGMFLDFYRPAVIDTNNPMPVVVLFHGQLDPALMGDMKELPHYRDLAKVLASRGYVVLVPNLGAAASGPKPEHWNTHILEVAANADSVLQYLKFHAEGLNADVDRLGIWCFGAAGQYGAGLALSKWQNNVKAIVTSCAHMAEGNLPLANPQLPLAQRRSLSPFYQMVVQEWAPQMLVLQAAHDAAYINESMVLFKRQANVLDLPVQLSVHEQGHHRFETVDATDQTRQVIESSITWLDGCLKNRRELKNQGNSQLAPATRAASGSGFQVSN